MLFSNPKFIQNPYPYYEELRKNGEIFFDKETNAWLVLSARIATELLSSNDIYFLLGEDKLKKIESSNSIFDKFLKYWFLYQDKEKHLSLRRALGAHFNPKIINELKQKIVEICFNTIQELPEGDFDFRKHFSTKVSIKVLCSVLGIETPDYEKISYLTNLIANFVGFIKTDKHTRMYTFGTNALYEYIKTILVNGNYNNKGVIHTLACLREKGEINEEELIFNILFFFTAGVEEPSSGITNCLVQLLQNPEKKEEYLLQLNRQNDFVDELMRMESSIQYLSRTNRYEVDLLGHKIAPKSHFVILVNAINSDPEVYQNPREINFNRDKSKHFTFGEGIHFCLGYYLSKLQIELGLNSVLTICNSIKIVEEPLWTPRFGLRAYNKLMVNCKNQGDDAR